MPRQSPFKLTIQSVALSGLLLSGLVTSASGQTIDGRIGSDEVITGVPSEAAVHAGVQLVDALTGTDGVEAFYAELNTGLGLHSVPYLTLLADGRLESLNATSETDDRISLFAQVRPGIRLEVPTFNNLLLFGEASAVRTWEWYRENGELQEDYPASYTSALYNIGVSDRYRGAQWRLSGAYDGYQALAGRQPLQVRGDVHIVEEGRNTWGVNGRISPDYMSLGLSLRLR